MPPTATERLAVQAHAALIDQYEKTLAEERDRLLRGRLGVCLADWFAVLVVPLPITKVHGRLHDRHYFRRHGKPAGSIITAYGRFFRLGPAVGSITTVSGKKRLNKSRRTLLRIRRLIDHKLARFAAEHRPKAEPRETPAKLVAWIDERFSVWKRLPELLALIPSGQAAIAADPSWFPPPSPTGAPVYPEQEARDCYREALGRSHAFSPLLPTILTDLPTRPDPIGSLIEIRTYFAALAEPIDDPEPATKPEEGGPTETDPLDRLIANLYRRGAKNQARLLEFMRSRDVAPFNEIVEFIYDDVQTSGDAIRQNVHRVNDALIESGLPYVFTTASERVHKV